MNISMKIEGVNGSVSEKEHRDWIELVSMNFKVTNDAAMITGETEDRQHTVPQFSQCHFSKEVDMASNKLFQLINRDTFLPEVLVHIHDTKNNLMEYSFKNVLITHREIDMTHGSKPTEFFSISYSEVNESLNCCDKNNKPLSPERSGYNIEKAKPH